MPVAQAVFLIVAAVGSAYLTMRRRRFDFYTIAFASSLLYFLPGFFGFVRSSSDFTVSTPLLPQTYFVFSAVLGAIVVGALIFDEIVPIKGSRPRRSIDLSMSTETALAVAAFGLVATIVTSGDVLFSASKSEVLESVGRWHILFRFGAIFSLVFAVVRKQFIFGACAVAMLLFDLFIGFRSGIVIGSLAAAAVALNRQGPQALIVQQRATVLLGLVAIAFVLVYKQIYTAIKLGLWDTVADRLFTVDIASLALLNSEPFTTQSVLNEVLRTQFITGPEHLASVAALLVPFANVLGVATVSYNDLYQPVLFGGVVTGGLANNIWAQFYSIGGYAFLAMGIIVYTSVLGLGSWFLLRSRGAGLALAAVVFTFVAFYIHRNDIGFTLTLVRRAFFIWVVLIVPALLLADLHRLGKRRPVPR